MENQANYEHRKNESSATAYHTETPFRNIIELTRNQIVFTIFRLDPNGRLFGSKSIGKW